MNSFNNKSDSRFVYLPFSIVITTRVFDRYVNAAALSAFGAFSDPKDINSSIIRPNPIS